MIILFLWSGAGSGGKTTSSFYLFSISFSIVHSIPFKYFSKLFELVFGSCINAYLCISSILLKTYTPFTTLVLLIPFACILEILENKQITILYLWKALIIDFIFSPLHPITIVILNSITVIAKSDAGKISIQ